MSEYGRMVQFFTEEPDDFNDWLYRGSPKTERRYQAMGEVFGADAVASFNVMWPSRNKDGDK